MRKYRKTKKISEWAIAKQGLSLNDSSSYSNTDMVVVRHIDLHLEVDFEKTRLFGKVYLTVEQLDPKATSVILDTRDLHIQSVKDVATGQDLQFNVGKKVLTFGSKLRISLPVPESSPEEEPSTTWHDPLAVTETVSETESSVKTEYNLMIQYETSSTASGLQWLPPEQTAGKEFPYMFSQCQPIHCRSIVPCQDTPGVKATYSAEMIAPAELTVLMSAKHIGQPQELADGKRLFKFNQKNPIPSYLIAIAVGKLESRKIGRRTHVWCEKEYIDKAEYEFGETTEMLFRAEQICGPYEWDIYDILVLPPSFPYGGMENPCLTFITPTLLAGDRSLVDVIGHEIAHSWTGNLITNADFNHFWLNEGFTMFVERKILARMRGPEYRHLSALQGLDELRDTIHTLGEDNPMTCLVPNLKGIDPDDAFSTVPYEKGHTFLFYIEQLVGGAVKFDPFLRNYIETFKFKSITTDDFKNHLYEFFPDNEELKEIDWDKWLYSPGMPPVIPEYDMTLYDACKNLAQRWIDWEVADGCCFSPTDSPFSCDDMKNLSTLQIIGFLGTLLESEVVLPILKLYVMNALYGYNETKNCEIKFKWLRICIKSQWETQIPRALEFINEQGRMKYVRPIYRDLYHWEEARERTITNFNSNKASMMFVSSHQLMRDLHIIK